MITKRDRLQVIYDILKTIQNRNGNIKYTHILYKANLSSQMMIEYIKDLIKRGFVLENTEKRGRTYSLTKKGFDYVAKYKFIIEFVDSFGLHEDKV